MDYSSFQASLHSFPKEERDAFLFLFERVSDSSKILVQISEQEKNAILTSNKGLAENLSKLEQRVEDISKQVSLMMPHKQRQEERMKRIEAQINLIHDAIKQHRLGAFETR
jgi:peptidoglycan hydrolase CwlO-like protein